MERDRQRISRTGLAFLTVILSVILLFSGHVAAGPTSIPVGSFDELKSALSGPETEITLAVTADFSWTETLTISGKNITITDNGTPVTLTRDVALNGPLFTVAADGGLTLAPTAAENLIFDGAGTTLDAEGMPTPIDGTAVTSDASFADVSGTFDMTGGIIQGFNVYKIDGATVRLKDGAVATMTGGSIRNNYAAPDESAKWRLLAVSGVRVHAGAKFTMDGTADIGNNRGMGSAVYVGDWKIGDGRYGGGSEPGLPLSEKPLAQFYMNGGRIHNNEVVFSLQEYRGGGLTVRLRAYAEMNGGSIDHNVAGSGGGVSVSNLSFDFYDNIAASPRVISPGYYRTGGYTTVSFKNDVNNFAQRYDLPYEEYRERFPSIFVMNGGVIDANHAKAQELGDANHPKWGFYNRTGQAGGIFMDSDDIYLNKGRITNNKADSFGGGMFAEEFFASVHLNNVLFKENRSVRAPDGVIVYQDPRGPNSHYSATQGTGSAIWMCPTGDLVLGENANIGFTGNETTSTSLPKDDIFWLFTPSITDTVEDFKRILTNTANTTFDFLRDEEDGYAWSEKKWSNAIAHSIVTDESAFDLIISGNEGSHGGGLASNNHVYIGGYKLALNKTFLNADGTIVPEEELPESVAFDVLVYDKQKDSLAKVDELILYKKDGFELKHQSGIDYSKVGGRRTFTASDKVLAFVDNERYIVTLKEKNTGVEAKLERKITESKPVWTRPDTYLNTEDALFKDKLTGLHHDRPVYEITAVNEPPASLEILKKDEHGEPMPAISFDLYRKEVLKNEGGEVISETMVKQNWQEGKTKSETHTNLDGILRIDGLSPGTYKLVETVYPEGYHPQTREVTIDKAGAVIKIEIINERYGSYQFTKADGADTTVLLSGAEYGLYIRGEGNALEPVLDNEDKPITTMTDKDGVGKFDNLDLGDYVMKEIRAPEGYALDETEHDFSITEYNKVVTPPENQPVTDRKIGILKLKKVSTDEAATPIPGTKFELLDDKMQPVTDSEGQPVTGITDAFGLWTIRLMKLPQAAEVVTLNDLLSAGTYYVRETASSEGYIQNPEPVKFIVDDTGAPVELTVTNNPDVKVTLIKTMDGELMPVGTKATFTLIRVDGATETPIGEYTTTDTNPVTAEQGRITVSGLIPGHYIWRETTPPTGYHPVDDVTFDIATGQTAPVEVLIDNMPEKTDVYVEKVWVDGPEAEHVAATVQLFRKVGEQAEETVGEPKVTTQEEGGWFASWKDLPKYNKYGELYVYRVDELNPPAGYEKTVEKKTGGGEGMENDFLITNRWTVPEGDITATKIWAKGDTLTRPDNVYFELLADGVKAEMTGENENPKQLTETQATWRNLPLKKKDGTPITYTVREVMPSGENYVDWSDANYTTTVDGLTVTNTWHTSDRELHATKIWSGGKTTEHVQPNLTVYQNGAVYEVTPMVTKQDDNTYLFTWTVPEADDFGQPYVYAVAETDTHENYGTSGVTGAGTAEDPFVITNTYGSPKGTHQAVKSWIDGPAVHPTIRLQLMRKLGETAEPVGESVDLGNGKLTHEWIDLPLTTQDGEDYTYYVEEIAIGGLSVTEGRAGNYVSETVTTGNVTSITNTYESPKISLSGQKTWTGDAEAVRPAEITVELLRNGAPLVPPVTKTVTAADGWAYSFDDLPETDTQGTAYTYTVREQNIPEDYEATVDGMNVANRYTKELMIPVEKRWFNSDGTPMAAERLPEAVTVRLLRNNTEVEAVELKATSKTPWAATFSPQPIYDETGNAYEYRVTEDAVAGYEALTDGTPEKGFIVKNTYVLPKTDITAKKNWIGGEAANGGVRPSIVLSLMRQVNGGDPVAVPAEEALEKILANGMTEVTWANLPAEDLDGNAYAYSVREVKIGDDTVVETEGILQAGNYTVTVDGLTVTNTYVADKTEVVLKKNWDGGETITPLPKAAYQLYRQVEGEGKQAVGEPLELTRDASGTNEIRWTDLPVTDESGRIYIYSAQESTVPENYVSGEITGTGTAEDPFVTTNTYESPRGVHKVEKKWVDGPENHPTIRLQLMRKLAETAEAYGDTVDLGDGKLTYEWTGLPLQAHDGRAYEYYVEEIAVDGETVTDGRAGKYLLTAETTDNVTMLTNTYESPKISLSGRKNWTGDTTDVRPAAITVELLQNGEPLTPAMTQSVTAADGWRYTFNDLPETDASGTAYTYTVRENDVPENYEATVDGMNLTNRYVKQLTIPVYKEWYNSDGSTMTAERLPEAVTVRLLQNGTEVDVLQLTATSETPWQGTFRAQPIYDETGKLYEYQVTEDAVPGYEALTEGDAGEGFTVKNTYVLQKLEIKAVKQWVGGEEANGGVRPDIVLGLMRKVDGYPAEAVPVEEAPEQTLTDGITEVVWTDLPAEDMNGKAYTYTVRELKIGDMPVTETDGIMSADNYAVTVDGLTVTNTYTASKTEVVLHKTWSGGELIEPLPQAAYQLFRRVAEEGKQAVGEPVMFTRDASGMNEIRWTDLPETDERGRRYIYSVAESLIPDNYVSGEVTGSGTAEDPFVTTNTYLPDTTNLRIRKQWHGVGNPDEMTATFNVTAHTPDNTELTVTDIDGTLIPMPVTLTGDNQVVLKALPVTTTAGEPIIYDVTEEAIPDFEATRQVLTNDGCCAMAFEYLNTYVGTSELALLKRDEQGTPLAGATFTLYTADGTTVVMNAISDETGKVLLTDLKPSSRYLLKETKAPTGYLLNETALHITVGADGTVTVSGDAGDITERPVPVMNRREPEKPEEPETPEKPEEPETPEKPEEPEKPEKPEKPETPEKPEKPEQPETPHPERTQPGGPGSYDPGMRAMSRNGVPASQVGIYLWLMPISAAFMFIMIRRRRSK